jgi:hypothetical protein
MGSDIRGGVRDRTLGSIGLLLIAVIGLASGRGERAEQSFGSWPLSAGSSIGCRTQR